MNKFLNSSRGQFFSPDLIMATGVFVICLGLFLAASNSIFADVESQESQKSASEAAHSALNLLMYSSGQPSDWHLRNLEDINYFGLADSISVLDKQKVLALIGHLNDDNNYSSAKQKIGAGKFDFYFRLVDSSGETLSEDGVTFSGGRVASAPVLKLIYRRIASYNGEQVLFEATFSFS
jgi:hypothetical protein